MTAANVEIGIIIVVREWGKFYYSRIIFQHTRMKKTKKSLKTLSKTCLKAVKGGGYGNGKPLGYQKWEISSSTSGGCCPPLEPSDNL